MISTITVRHSRGSYEVLSCGVAELCQAIPTDRVVLTDENVWRFWHTAWPEEPRVLVLPAGEQTKSLRQLEAVFDWLVQSGASRETEIVAFGGGVIGDLAGFAAATYMRGVPLVQIPTTLLSQVDSSVGGKVGVDLCGGKNLVGAFHPPRAVHIVPEMLLTLPERQFHNGMAEVWKYGFIMDVELANSLRERPLQPGSEQLSDVVARCIDLKRQIVEEDERDRLGLRAILNFGHTVGHAIEQATGYGPLLHGEAIAIGMVIEAAVGERIGVTTAGTSAFIGGCLAKSHLPLSHSILKKSDLLVEAMRRDKKSSGGAIAMSLVTEIGKCKLVPAVPEEAIRAVLAAC